MEQADLLLKNLMLELLQLLKLRKFEMLQHDLVSQLPLALYSRGVFRSRLVLVGKTRDSVIATERLKSSHNANHAHVASCWSTRERGIDVQRIRAASSFCLLMFGPICSSVHTVLMVVVEEE